MDLYTLVLLFFTLIAPLIWILTSSKKKINLPGPTGLPFVGYFPYLTSTPHLKLVELSKTYGPLYQIRLGNKDVIVACGYKEIREALENVNFSDRPENKEGAFKELRFGSGGRSSVMWKDRKQFTLKILSEIGIGNISSEPIMQEEITILLKRLQATNKSPIFLKRYLTASISSSVLSWLFGKKVPQEDPLHEEICHLMQKAVFLPPTSFHYYFPWIHSIGKIFRLYSFLKAVSELRKIISTEIQRHEKKLTENHIESLLDGYLSKLQDKKEKENEFLRRAVLEDLAFVFFLAGTESVSIYVEWVLLVVAEFPDVQVKIQEELDEVFGQETFPSFQDRRMTPYLEAVISETYRWISFLPINSLRMSKEDFEFRGQWIPKNTLLMTVFHGILHDKSLFGDDVDVFRPERFLSEDGQTCLNPPYFLPFSTGSRSCPGKAHGKREVYLYVAAILRKFRISPPPGKKVDLEGIIKAAKFARPQNVCLELRQ